MNTAGNHEGPGIQLEKSSTLKIKNVNFIGFKHAAIYADRVAGVDTTIDGCKITGTTGEHSSIDITSEGANITIINSIFESNILRSSGGSVFLDTANAIIKGCTFRNNTAGWGGGGLYIWEGKVIISDSVFIWNQGNHGGAIILMYVAAGSIIKSSNITDNIATGKGGGIFYKHGHGLTIEKDVIIKGNEAGIEGYGIDCDVSVKPTLPSSGFDDEIDTNCLQGLIMH